MAVRQMRSIFEFESNGIEPRREVSSTVRPAQLRHALVRSADLLSWLRWRLRVLSWLVAAWEIDH